MRRRQSAAMTAWVLAGARSQPLVLAFEDLHWADPTSLDLLQRAGRARRAGAAARSSRRRGRSSARLGAALAPWRDLARAARSRTGRANGRRNRVAPCVVEGGDRRRHRAHRRRAAVRRGSDAAAAGARRSRAARRRSRRPCSSRSPPVSTGSAPRARSRRSARCSGAVFPTRCWKSVAGVDDRGHGMPGSATPARASMRPGPVGARTARRRRPAVRRGRSRPHANYRFKHALIQDAAYDSLLKSRRQTLHRRAAELLRVARRAAAEPEGARAPFHASRSRRSRDRMVGQGGRSGFAPLGLRRGDLASRQGDRYGGQGGRREDGGRLA